MAIDPTGDPDARSFKAAIGRNWKFIAAVALLAALAVARVASTYRVYGETIDEPMHLAAGWQWLTSRYTTDLGHPPLIRALCALPLLVSGYPPPRSEDPVQRGNDLLYVRHRYETTLALARSANALLLVVAIVATALWARRTYSTGVAILAAAIYTSLPPVLGHAGLITNDLGAAATLTLALLALEWYLDAPSPARAGWTGLAVAIGVLTKFSFLVFFPATALILLVWRRTFRWRDAGVAALVALFVVWGGYKFDFGTAKELSKDGVFLFHYAAPEPLRPFTRRLAEVPLPAPAFSVGLATLAFHNQQGHDAYLLGEVRSKGWWYYFPVVFFYKTPIPFLILTACGAVFARKHFAVASVVLVVAMTASINIGVRHILPIYAPLSIVAAVAVVKIWSRETSPFGRGALAALVLWLFGGVALAGRDMLPWFNELAQPNPAAIAVRQQSRLGTGHIATHTHRA